MLVPTVSISTSALSDKTQEEIVKFAAHMSILGPIAVYLNFDSLQQEENSEYNIIKYPF